MRFLSTSLLASSKSVLAFSLTVFLEINLVKWPSPYTCFLESGSFGFRHNLWIITYFSVGFVSLGGNNIHLMSLSHISKCVPLLWLPCYFEYVCNTCGTGTLYFNDWCMMKLLVYIYPTLTRLSDTWFWYIILS